jgi:integrase
MDADTRRTAFRRPLLATLVFAGLRIDEALSLRWDQVSLAGRSMRVGSKTDAGHRTIGLLPIPVDELVTLKVTTKPEPDALVFPSKTGAKQSYSNIRQRLLSETITRANGTLEGKGLPPLPEPLTPHSMRRTFFSVLLALGSEVSYVMEQAGHADPKVTLGICARVIRRTADDKERLKALAEGIV